MIIKTNTWVGDKKYYYNIMVHFNRYFLSLNTRIKVQYIQVVQYLFKHTYFSNRVSSNNIICIIKYISIFIQGVEIIN